MEDPNYTYHSTPPKKRLVVPQQSQVTVFFTWSVRESRESLVPLVFFCECL